MNEYITQIKDRFPKVYSILQYINGRRLYYSKEYIQTRKRLRSNRQNKKLPRIAFIVDMPETWNSFVSVYKEALYRELQVLVLAVPLDEKSVGKKDRRDNCKSYVYLKESGVNVVNAYSSDNKEWFDLESWQPDYVFYTRTYDTEYPVRYRSKNVSQYAEICVIPYGYSIVKGSVFDIAYGKRFFSRVSITFATNMSSAKLIKDKIKHMGLSKYNIELDIGYPRFDLYADRNIDNKKNKIDTIAWLPRFVFQKERINYPSHFLDFYEQFLELAKKHSTIQFIIRPHPLMFPSMIKNEIKTKEEVENILQRVNNSDNICFDFIPDYTDTLLKADLLIADFTSLIAEFLATGNPVILCDIPDMFLDGEIKLADLSYPGLTWSQVENTVEALIGGKDPLAKKREEYRKDIFADSKNTIGARIVDYIINDYCQ